MLLRGAVLALILCVATSGRLPVLSRLNGQIDAAQKPVQKGLEQDQLIQATASTHAGAQQPGIELAARQVLFNFATKEGLRVLTAKVQVRNCCTILP